MKRQLIQLSLAAVVLTASVCAKETPAPTEQNSITIEGIALNPEGIEYDSTDKTFLLSSFNAQ
jgi:hypothetical protein